MPRFAILFHQTPPEFDRPNHWDLLLEDGTSLATWALDAEPVEGISMGAISLPAHRRAYLEYEGPLSAGRGTVSRWDDGSFRWLERGTHTVRCQLHGRRLVGQACLFREPENPRAESPRPRDETGAATEPNAQRWTFTFAAEG